MAALLAAVWLCHKARKRWSKRSALKDKLSPLAAAREVSEFRPLRDRLSVVITTSACGRNPSTDMLDEVLTSLELAAGALACNIIIVCDGYRCAIGEGAASAPPKFKEGIVDAASAANYELYKGALRRRQRSETANEPALQLLELEARHGFGHAVRAALELVKTPYLMVVQHDRPFTRAVDLNQVVSAMEAHSDRIKYMGLPNSVTIGHAEEMLSKHDIHLGLIDVNVDGLQALPLCQWYDSTHVCEVEHYRKLVFGPQSPVDRGSFIEEKLAPAQLADIRRRGLAAAHGRYGTFMASGASFKQPCVGQVERDSLSDSKVRLLGAPTACGNARTAAALANLETRPPKKRPTGAEAPGRPPVANGPHHGVQAAAHQNGKHVATTGTIMQNNGNKAAVSETERNGHAAADGAAAADEECLADGWEYVDPRRKVQGPFSLTEMRHWNSKGYFRPELLMRCASTDKFIPFSDLFPQPRVPFVSAPLRPQK